MSSEHHPVLARLDRVRKHYGEVEPHRGVSAGAAEGLAMALLLLVGCGRLSLFTTAAQGEPSIAAHRGEGSPLLECSESGRRGRPR